MAGPVLQSEIQQGQINHALVLGTPGTRSSSYIACPGTNADGSAGSTAIPEGAQLQLDPSINVDAQNWSPWVKTIAKAMQTYGIYVRDTTGNAAIIYGVTDDNPSTVTWSTAGVPVDQYNDLDVIPWSSMRVIKMKQTMGNGVCQ
jgi:hypothetical protein